MNKRKVIRNIDGEIDRCLCQLVTYDIGSDERNATLDEVHRLQEVRSEISRKATGNKISADAVGKIFASVLGTAATVGQLYVMTKIFNECLEFEKTGTFTTFAFKNFLGWVKPKF